MALITGTSGDDTLKGQTGSDTILGGEGDDSLVAAVAGSSDSSIKDDFSGSVLDGSKWTRFAPFSDSKAYTSSGSLVLQNCGTVALKTQTKSPYTLKLTGVTLSDWEVFSVGLRTPGAIDSGSEVVDGLRINIWNHSTSLGLDYYSSKGGPSNDNLGAGTFQRSAVYDIEVTDDLENVSIKINNATVLQVASTLSSGDQVVLYNRSTQRGWAIPSTTKIGNVELTTEGDSSLPSSGDNSLSGGAGNDTLRGGGGNDTLDGGDGNDLLVVGSLRGGSKYEIVQGAFTWEQAKLDAENRGGQLATISSLDEWNQIKALPLAETLWLGATDAQQEGSWRWIDGTEWNFSNWQAGEPNNWGEADHYLLIISEAGNTWYDASDGHRAGYILESAFVGPAASGHNSLSGGAGNDTLLGAGGNDTLNGGAGADSMVGGNGNDTYRVDSVADVLIEASLGGTDSVFASVSHTLGANFENLAATSSAGLSLRGNGLQNFITGGAGADTLDGGGTDGVIRIAIFPTPIIPDTLSGGLGNDLYITGNAFDPDVIIEAPGGGTDTVRSSVTHALAANVEDLELTGAGAINGTGNALANRITGNAAANRLVAGAGNDNVFGGAGNDTLSAGLGNDTVKGEAGNDLLQIDWASLAGATIARSIRKDGTGTAASFSGSYTAKNASGAVLSQVSFDTIERLTLNGQVVDLEKAVAVPGVTIKRISAAAATTEQGGTVEYNVVLDKAPFEDVTLNFASSDATEGKVNTPSLIFTALNWDKPQKLVVQGVDDYLDDGNVAYTINGQVATADLTYNRIKVPVLNLLNNDDGQDNDRIIYGSDDTDYLTGANGHDRIYGKGGQDQLRGSIGNDRVYGENDNDRLFGEAGNDELYGGYDDDTLDGGAGADSLFGEQGRDTLLGGAGNDYLDGGLLNDSMSGGAGNDTYLVDSAGDVINDLGATSDVDTVQVIQTISYTLPANVENAAITAGGNGNITGNTLNNGLTGNDGRNVIDGGVGNDRLDGAGGADSLLGGTGNDVFLGGMGNDTMRGGAGVDVVDFLEAGVDLRVDLNTGRVTGEGTDLLFDIENIMAGDGFDTLLGNSAANDLDGGAGIDILNGGAGNDILAGCFFGASGGRDEIDTLTGGAGIDVFQLGWSSGRFYDDGVAGNAGRNDYVLITDFTVGQDRLQLDGDRSNYYLGQSGVNGVAGIGLYAEQGATDELIAIIRSANATQPNAANTINTAQFI